MDMSVRSGDSRVQPCYDDKWRCFSDCRPHKEGKEAARILTAFETRPMFLHIVANDEKTNLQRHVKALGDNYVAVPTGSHLAVLSDVPLGDDAHSVKDKAHLVTAFVMKVRWDEPNLSSSRGFLPPARKRKKSDKWEAYHPSTGRICGHIHARRGDAEGCATEIGVELDGSSDGWYVRNTTEWKALGTVKMTTLSEVAASAEKCGLRVAVTMPDEPDHNGSLMILATEWDDERYVRWRAENHYAKPATATDWWRPPALEQDWAVDHRGRITGT
jgi:hypothetical protein